MKKLNFYKITSYQIEKLEGTTFVVVFDIAALGRSLEKLEYFILVLSCWNRSLGSLRVRDSFDSLQEISLLVLLVSGFDHPGLEEFKSANLFFRVLVFSRCLLFRLLMVMPRSVFMLPSFEVSFRRYICLPSALCIKIVFHPCIPQSYNIMKKIRRYNFC